VSVKIGKEKQEERGDSSEKGYINHQKNRK
jgi:hypothetical protein